MYRKQQLEKMWLAGSMCLGENMPANALYSCLRLTVAESADKDEESMKAGGSVDVVLKVDVSVVLNRP